MNPEAAPSPPQVPPRDAKSASTLWRLSGIGFELAAAILGATLVGWLLDRWFGTSPMWTFIGAGIGIIGGGYNFIRSAMRMNRQAIEEYRRAHPPGARRPGLSAGPRGPAGAGMFERSTDDETPNDDTGHPAAR